jgi:hypothetical protein
MCLHACFYHLTCSRSITSLLPNMDLRTRAHPQTDDDDNEVSAGPHLT